MCHVTTAGDPLPDDVMVVSSPEELLQELELSFDSSFNRGYVRDSLGKRRCLLQKHDCQLLVAEDQIDWLRSHKGERRSVCETILLQGHVTTDDAGTLPRCICVCLCVFVCVSERNPLCPYCVGCFFGGMDVCLFMYVCVLVRVGSRNGLTRFFCCTRARPFEDSPCGAG